MHCVLGQLSVYEGIIVPVRKMGDKSSRPLIGVATSGTGNGLMSRPALFALFSLFAQVFPVLPSSDNALFSSYIVSIRFQKSIYDPETFNPLQSHKALAAGLELIDFEAFAVNFAAR